MKTLVAKLVAGIALLGLLGSIASCCCLGGSDSDNNGDTDIVQPGVHNEGGGANV